MLGKIVVGIALGVLLVVAGVFFWARSVLAGDGVRLAVTAQLTRTLRQPVEIGAVSATIFPRVTLSLDGVAIGSPARITADHLLIGASLRALLSRRIEHASVRLMNARVEWPLPEFAFLAAGETTGASRAGPPLEIVSVDEILLHGATFVSGDRTLIADLEIVPDARGLVIRRCELAAGGETMHISGHISDLAAPAAILALTAETLHLDELLLFAADFASGANGPGDETNEPASPAAGRPPGMTALSAMQVELSVTVDRASFGTVEMTALEGHARVTSSAWTFETVHFGLFDGAYDGTLTLTPQEAPAFRLNASIAHVDMGAVAAFAGHPGVITGRLAGTLDVNGRGSNVRTALASARGTARVSLADGVVRNLGLVRAVVLAGSMRPESQAAARDVASDEPFSRLDATLAIANGTARTGDLRFQSPDVRFTADGTFALDGSAVDLDGQVQLSEALTQQAGRDLVRYTREDGRVTLPVTVSGSIADFTVGIDLVDLTRRAIINRATDEAEEAIRKGIGGLIGR